MFILGALIFSFGYAVLFGPEIGLIIIGGILMIAKIIEEVSNYR
jgi:hypothetical protein